MRSRVRTVAGLLLVLFAVVAAAPQEAVDRSMNDRITREGLERSHAARYFEHFVTVVGPRLTGSPAHKAAAEWARQELESAGLKDSHLEPWEFGRGWELTGFTLEMTAPRFMPLIGYPEGWSASTAGSLQGTPIFVGNRTAAQIEAERSSFKGAIVLTQPLQTEFVRQDRAQPTATRVELL